MHLLEKLKEKAKHLTEETDLNTSDKAANTKAGAETAHGFMDAVKEEIGAPKEGETSPHEVTVEDIYQDLAQRKQKGVMPRNPMEALMDTLGKRPASEVYASGAVFDLSRLYRDHFIKAMQAPDTLKLFDLFRASFSLFVDQPEVIGLNEKTFNRKNIDTDPTKWNVSQFAMENGDQIALCYMPIESRTLTARIIGIIFSDSGDRYYYCMLNKDENTPSEVTRNTGKLPFPKAGEVSGKGFDLMSCFLDVMKKDRGAETGGQAPDGGTSAV